MTTTLAKISAMTPRAALVLSLLPLASALVVGPTPIPAPRIAQSLSPVSAAAVAARARRALRLTPQFLHARARPNVRGPAAGDGDEDVEEIANEMTKTQKVLKGLHPIARWARRTTRSSCSRADGVVPDAGGAGGGDVGARRRQHRPPLRQAAQPAALRDGAGVGGRGGGGGPQLQVARPRRRRAGSRAVGLDPDEFQRVLSTIIGRYLRSVVAEDDAVDT